MVHRIHELVSNQGETDTQVVLYLGYAVKLGYKSAVVRTTDTGIIRYPPTLCSLHPTHHLHG